MGAVVEIKFDNKGIIWPESVAPFRVHLLSLNNESRIINKADKIYNSLQKEGLKYCMTIEKTRQSVKNLMMRI